MKDTGNLAKILASPQMDKKSFHEILKNTDLVQHKQLEEKKNPYYDPKNNKYKRVKAQPASYASPYETDAHIKQATTQFLQNKITPDEYRETLKKQGINADVEGINKYIRSKEEGNQISFSDMVRSISTHKKDSIISPQDIIHKGKDCRFREDPGKENMEKLMMVNKTNNK